MKCYSCIFIHQKKNRYTQRKRGGENESERERGERDRGRERVVDIGEKAREQKRMRTPLIH